MASKKYYAGLAAIFSLVTALGLYNVNRGLKNNPDFGEKAKTEQSASLEASILNRTPVQSSGLLKQILENPLNSDEGILYNPNSVDKIIESHGENRLENIAYKKILSHRKDCPWSDRASIGKYSRANRNQSDRRHDPYWSRSARVNYWRPSNWKNRDCD